MDGDEFAVSGWLPVRLPLPSTMGTLTTANRAAPEKLVWGFVWRFHGLYVWLRQRSCWKRSVGRAAGVYPSAPYGPGERRSRAAGGDVSVSPCIPASLHPPPAPVTLQVSAVVRPLAAGDGRSRNDGGVKPVRKLIWMKVKWKL